MVKQVRGPDGRVVQFPDGTTDAEIAAAMRREYGGPEKPRPASFGLGFDKGFGRVVDNAALAMDKGLEAVGVPMDRINRALGNRTAEETVARNRARLAEREQTRRPGVVGEHVGSAFGAAPVVVATRNPWVVGGMTGGLNTEADTPEGVAFDVGAGAVLGKIGDKAVGLVADVVKPVVQPAVQRLHAAGVKLSPGMVRGGKAMAREDKLTSKPVVGDRVAADRRATLETMNTAVVNRIIAPLDDKLPATVRPGHDAVAYAKTAIDAGYERVVPNLKVALDGEGFTAKIAPTAATLPEPQQQQLKQILGATLRDGQLVGRDLKLAQGELRRLASVYSRDAAAPNRELGRALWAADEELTRVMYAQNPKWAPELRKVNEAYRGYRIVADAASRADDGILNTGQLKQAVRRGDSTKNKDATARGAAFLQDFSEDARAVIPSRVPDSGTSGRQQAGSLLGIMTGAADVARYRADQGISQMMLAPRPVWADPTAAMLRRLRTPGAMTAATMYPQQPGY